MNGELFSNHHSRPNEEREKGLLPVLLARLLIDYASPLVTERENPAFSMLVCVSPHALTRAHGYSCDKSHGLYRYP